jgi:DNA-binding response OmpR family regulator
MANVKKSVSRKKEKTAVLLITPETGRLPEKMGLEAGANEYSMKPFDPRAVLSRVRELLG